MLEVHLVESGRAFEIWMVSGSHRFLLSRAAHEDQAVIAALQLLEDFSWELKQRRLLIKKAPDLPLGAA